MQDHPVKTPGEWPGRLVLPEEGQGSPNPFEGEFALYDMLKFRTSVDFTASRKSSGVVPEDVAAAVASSSSGSGSGGPTSSPSAHSALTDSTLRTPSTHHVSFASSPSTPIPDTPTTASAPTSSEIFSAAKPVYRHPFAVPDPRGKPKVHVRMELENPHPFSLAEGVARSLSAPPAPAPPPPTRTPSIASRRASRDDSDLRLEQERMGRYDFGEHHQHLDALLRARKMSNRLVRDDTDGHMEQRREMGLSVVREVREVKGAREVRDAREKHHHLDALFRAKKMSGRLVRGH